MPTFQDIEKWIPDANDMALSFPSEGIIILENLQSCEAKNVVALTSLGAPPLDRFGTPFGGFLRADVLLQNHRPTGSNPKEKNYSHLGAWQLRDSNQWGRVDLSGAGTWKAAPCTKLLWVLSDYYNPFDRYFKQAQQIMLFRFGNTSQGYGLAHVDTLYIQLRNSQNVSHENTLHFTGPENTPAASIKLTQIRGPHRGKTLHCTWTNNGYTITNTQNNCRFPYNAPHLR